MTDLYCFMLQQSDSAIDGKVFNAGYENHTVMQLAELVNGVMGGQLAVDVQPSDDMRSYHVSSEKLKRSLGFSATHSIEDAVRGLIGAFKDNRLHDPMNNPMYFNIKRMQQLNLR